MDDDDEKKRQVTRDQIIAIAAIIVPTLIALSGYTLKDVFTTTEPTAGIFTITEISSTDFSTISTEMTTWVEPTTSIQHSTTASLKSITSQSTKKVTSSSTTTTKPKKLA